MKETEKGNQMNKYKQWSQMIKSKRFLCKANLLEDIVYAKFTYPRIDTIYVGDIVFEFIRAMTLKNNFRCLPDEKIYNASADDEGIRLCGLKTKRYDKPTAIKIADIEVEYSISNSD